jgi:hypothetical protein
LADALALVTEAEKRLWSPEGAAALAYLKGRGLTEATIKAAGLGWTPRADGVPWKPPGVVIPWRDGDRRALVKIRPPDEWRKRFPEEKRPPKYIEAFRDRPRIYPGPEAIRPGMPLVIAEGEFDAMLLGQELADLASVITTGSSSTPIDPSMLPALLRCPRWYAAHDADDAGDRAAAEWPARAVRVRPPIEPPAGKDWSDAWKAGIEPRRWWVEEVLTDGFDREERAAIAEYCGGLPRGEAERLAGAPPARDGKRRCGRFACRATNE